MEELIGYVAICVFIFVGWLCLCEWWNGKKSEWRVKNYEQGNYYDTFEHIKQSIMHGKSTSRLRDISSGDINSIDNNAYDYHKLGYMYENGYGTTKDYNKAMQCYKKAEAWREIGYMYYFGHGVYKSKDKAKEYFAKCYDTADCEKIISYFEGIENYDDSASYFNLGLCYAKGKGIMQDYEKARYYYQKSADLGNSGAYNNLGCMYSSGKGVAQSSYIARSYFQTAADMGNATACNNVASYYENGTGGAKDKYQALKYYKKACDLGNKEANANYQRLKNEMGIKNDDAVLF